MVTKTAANNIRKMLAAQQANATTAAAIDFAVNNARDQLDNVIPVKLAAYHLASQRDRDAIRVALLAAQREINEALRML